MKALRQRVERIVRPVRASEPRKDRMRAELLEHLSMLYQQELERTGDEPAALEAATRRLGDPAELTRELQASVPRWLQWATGPLPGSNWGKRRVGESIERWIFRTTTAGCLSGGIALALIVVGIAAMNHRLPKLVPISQFLLFIPFMQWIVLASMFFISEWIRRAIESDMPRRKRITRVAGLGLVSTCIATGVAVVVALMIHRNSPYPLFSVSQAAVVCLGVGCFMSFLLAIQVREWIVRWRRYEQWESFDLESDSP